MSAPEIWKPIPDYVGRYEVSNLGRVKSLARWTMFSGRGRRFINDRILRPSIKRIGYPTVMLDRKVRTVHSLVLEAFVGPCPAGMEARHYPDRTRSNNRLDNLSWSSRKRNQFDRIEHGTSARGTGNGRAKLTEWDVQLIRTMTGTQQEIANHFGLGQSTVSEILRGKKWGHLNVNS